jgi:transcriptional regulator with XRE-family HTH domain
VKQWESFEGRLEWALKRDGAPTYDEVAEKVGTAKTRLSEWIGGTTVKLPFLQKLPGALGVDAGWLLTGEGRPEIRVPGEAEKTLDAIRLVLNPAAAELESRQEMAGWLLDRLDVPPEEVIPPSHGDATG